MHINTNTHTKFCIMLVGCVWSFTFLLELLPAFWCSLFSNIWTPLSNPEMAAFHWWDDSGMYAVALGESIECNLSGMFWTVGERKKYGFIKLLTVFCRIPLKWIFHSLSYNNELSCILHSWIIGKQDIRVQVNREFRQTSAVSVNKTSSPYSVNISKTSLWSRYFWCSVIAA